MNSQNNNGQPIGNVFDQNQPNPQQQQNNTLPFLPIMKSMHDLLEKYRKIKPELYPDEIRHHAMAEIDRLEYFEKNYLNLPETIKESIAQFNNNNVLPLFQ